MKTAVRPLLLLVLLAGLAVAITVLALRPDVAPAGITGGPPIAAAPAAPAGGSRLDGVLESAAEAMQRAVAAESRPQEEVAPDATDEAAAPAPPPDTPVLVGRVFDGNGRPIEGAQVTIERWTESSGFSVRVGGRSVGAMGRAASPGEEGVRTDARGRFTQERESKLGSEVAVEIRARGFLVLRERVELPEEIEDTFQIKDLFLQPGVVLAGRVVDPNGDPVAEARIRRATVSDDISDAMLTAFGDFGLGAAMGEVESDQDGQFELPHEEAGSFWLAIRHEAHPDFVFEGTGPAAGSTVEGLVITLPAGASIVGVVAGFPEERKSARVGAQAVVVGEAGDPEGGGGPRSGFAELMGATFAGGVERQAKIEPDGTFAVRGLVPGREYDVRVFEQRNFIETVDLSSVARARAGTTGVQLDFDHGSSITLEVLADDTGAPPERIRVRYDWAGEPEPIGFGASAQGEVFRKIEGPITVAELRPRDDPGFLDLSISADGYWTHTVEGVPIPMQDVVDLGTVRLSPAPRLRVRVLDGVTKQPVRRARVELVESSAKMAALAQGLPFGAEREQVDERTDREGWADLAVFRADAVDLDVTASGYAPHHHAGFEVPRSGSVDWTVHLSRGGAVDIVVLDTQGLPAADAVVHGRGDRARTLSVDHPDEEGRVAVEGLAPGEYRFRAVRGSSRTQVRVRVEPVDEDDEDWATAYVRDGERTALVLEVPAYGALHGVVRAAGLPLANARVSIVDDPGLELIEDVQSDLGEMLGGAQDGARTDSDGRYELERIPAGKHTVRVRHESRSMAARLPVDVEVGDNRLDVDLPGATVEGRILDAEGRPIAGALVEAHRIVEDEKASARLTLLRDSDFFGRDPGAVEADDAGRYRLEGVLVEAPIVVEARAPDYIRGSSDELVVGDGQIRTDVDLTLQQGGSIRATIEGAAGPFTFVTATRDAENGPPERQMAVARNGTALVTGLHPGVWLVKLARGNSPTAGEGEAVPVEVRAGVEAAVRLVP